MYAGSATICDEMNGFVPTCASAVDGSLAQIGDIGCDDVHGTASPPVSKPKNLGILPPDCSLGVPNSVFEVRCMHCLVEVRLKSSISPRTMLATCRGPRV